MSMTVLRGMTWSHPRGLASCRAATEAFTREHPEVSVEWTARSLQEFEDVSVTDLARRYDLIAIDHPFVGEAAATGALLPVDEVLPVHVLQDQVEHSVGPSAASYRWRGRQWALAMDAATQVSAYRPDVLPGPPPRTWDAAFALLADLPPGTVAELPANPTHLWASFVSLCHHAADAERTGPGPDGRPAWWPHTGIEPDVAATALGRLYRLLELVDPVSLKRDPITTLDAMAAGAPIAYVPLVYGYSNYARRGYAERLIRFAPAPSPGPAPAGTMIGGVGLAISASCPDVTAAAAVAGWLVSKECQAGIFLDAGGQPAHREVWTDPAANELTHRFFADTLPTLDASFLRARLPGYPAFQRRAGELLHEMARRQDSPARVVSALSELWGALCGAAS
jgi:multiple sugar transport system substrate-binding protein